jgi:hypothetical protein
MMKAITINKTTTIKPLNYDDKSHPSTEITRASLIGWLRTD